MGTVFQGSVEDKDLHCSTLIDRYFSNPANMNIVGICGESRSGKSRLASYIKNNRVNVNYIDTKKVMLQQLAPGVSGIALNNQITILHLLDRTCQYQIIDEVQLVNPQYMDAIKDLCLNGVKHIVISQKPQPVKFTFDDFNYHIGWFDLKKDNCELVVKGRKEILKKL